MTPKEKAQELVDKFYLNVLDREGTTAMNGFEVKQCALIAADEAIKVAYWPTARQYWKEVKEEIEKL